MVQKHDHHCSSQISSLLWNFSLFFQPEQTSNGLSQALCPEEGWSAVCHFKPPRQEDKLMCETFIFSASLVTFIIRVVDCSLCNV